MAEVHAYDRSFHSPGSVSFTGVCAQGGSKTCTHPAAFSVQGKLNIATCDEHLSGSVRAANDMPARAHV
jgi:hypothetical protein